VSTPGRYGTGGHQDVDPAVQRHRPVHEALHVGRIRHTAARDALGERTLFELSTLVGYYATLALQLRLFNVPAPTATPRRTDG
jgi:hypothetical protein